MAEPLKTKQFKKKSVGWIQAALTHPPPLTTKRATLNIMKTIWAKSVWDWIWWGEGLDNTETKRWSIRSIVQKCSPIGEHGFCSFVENIAHEICFGYFSKDACNKGNLPRITYPSINPTRKKQNKPMQGHTETKKWNRKWRAIRYVRARMQKRLAQYQRLDTELKLSDGQERGQSGLKETWPPFSSWQMKLSMGLTLFVCHSLKALCGKL